MKIMLSGLRVLLFCLAVVHHGNASESLWEYKNWSVSSQDKVVRFITNGDVVHGHQFGFIKKAGNCNQDLLWISWSTYEKGIEGFKGGDAAIRFRVGDAQFQLDIPLITVHHFTPTFTVLAFTNLVVGDELISILEKGRKIEVTIISPAGLSGKLDIPTDDFSLNGFIATRLKAREFCEGLR